MIIIIDEILRQYYGLSNFTVQEYDSYFVVFADSDVFFLYKVESIQIVEEFYRLSLLVDYADSFIFNVFFHIVTTVGNTSYVLIHKQTSKKQIIPSFSFFSVNERIQLSWRDLWIRRSDFILTHYQSIKDKFPIIQESIHYYIGLLEMSIYFLNDYENYSDLAVVQHRVFDEDEYCNPFNLILDVKERDFAEYLKFIFFNNSYQDICLEDLILDNHCVFEYDLVLARLLFPNYYFRLVDDVILGKKEEKCLIKVISRTNEYEDYLKKIISIVEKKFTIKKYPFL